MRSRTHLGELEQMVLLALLQAGDEAYAVSARRRLEDLAGRTVSRGVFYRTLDRLEDKGYLMWSLEAAGPERGGHPRRRFRVTPRGLAALRTSRAMLVKLWRGLEERLEER